MDTTSKEESEQIEPEIESLQDEASGTIDVDDEDEIEELHNSLKEVVKDPSVKPKLQCLMVDPSFSMVTVQSEDSGIVWETASSRCSTPWASEGSSPSESYSLESSGAQGKITVIMDEDKIVRKRKRSGRSKLGDRFKRPGSRTAAYGAERPAMAEVSVPNVRPENDESTELKVDKDQELFSLISEGYEILNIIVPSKLPTVDEEDFSDLVENLSYLQDTPKIKSKSKPPVVSAGENYQVNIQTEVLEIDDEEKSQADKDQASDDMMQAKKEGHDVDYLEKFKLVDPHVPSEQPSPPGVPEQENIIQEPEPKQAKPQEESKPKPSPSNIEDSFVIITEDEIASEHMDEVFYANIGCMAEENKGNESDGGLKDAPRSLKESGSDLFGSEETTLTPIYLPEGPPKIIDLCLLDEPRAMSFLYSDLYDEAIGIRRRDDDHSDAESTMSEKSYKQRFSDDDDDEGYLEKFILKDETQGGEDPPEVTSDTEGERIIWPQSKFEMTGCLKRVKEQEDSGGEKTETLPTEQMKDSEKAQPEEPEDTGKKVSQEPLTEAFDGSKTEQKKGDETEVCVGDHCEPCDSQTIIHESPGRVIPDDVSTLLLEDRDETVGQIKKHDGISEKAKDLKETLIETKESSGTVLEESLPTEMQQKALAEEVTKDTAEDLVKSQDMEILSSEDVSRKIMETPTIIKEGVFELENVSEIQSDVKISKEPEKEEIEVKKSDEIVAEQAKPEIEHHVEIQEEVVSKDKTVVPDDKSEVIVTAPETIKDNEEVQEIASVADDKSEIIVTAPETIKDNEEVQVIASVAAEILKGDDVIKSLSEVETEDVKPDTTEQEEVKATLLDEKSVAIEKTVNDDNLISADQDTTGPQLSVECEVQEQKDAIQEQVIDSISQTEIKTSEEVAAEPDKVVEKKNEALELHQQQSPALQANVEAISIGPEPEKVEEIKQAIEAPVEKVQESSETKELTGVDKSKDNIICDDHEPKVEDKKLTETRSEKNQGVTLTLSAGKLTMDFIIVNDNKDNSATVEQTQKIVAAKKNEVPVIEVVLGKAPLAQDIETENQLPTSKPEMPSVPMELKESGEPVCRTSEGVSVQNDLKQKLPQVSILPQAEVKSNTQTLEQSIEAFEKTVDAVRSAESERVELEVRELQAQMNEDSKVIDGNNSIAITQDDKEATVAVDKLDTKPDIPVTDKIVNDTVAEILSVEALGPETVSEEKVLDNAVSDVAAEIPSVKASEEVLIVENKVSGKTINDIVAEVPVVELQGPDVVGVEKVSDIIDVVAEIPSVQTSDEVLTVENKVSDKNVNSVTAEIPSIEPLGPEVVSAEAKESYKSVSDAGAEISSVETQGPEIVSVENKVSDITVNEVEVPSAETPDEVLTVENKVSDNTDVVGEMSSVEPTGPVIVTADDKVPDISVNDAVAKIPAVETPDEVLTVENQLLDKTDMVAEMSSAEHTGPVAVTADNKVPDISVNDVEAEIPAVETPDEVLTVENQLLDKIDMVAEMSSAEHTGPVAVTADNKVPDISVNDVEAEIPAVETPDEVLTVENQQLDKTDMVAEMSSVEVSPVQDTAVKSPSPSAATDLVKVEELTTEDQKEGEPVEEPEGPMFSPLRSFSPQEDLSVLPGPEHLKDPEYHDEMAEELDYEMVTQQEAREYPDVETEVVPEKEKDEHLTEEDKVVEEEAAEDVLEADYEMIEASESIQLSEEDQAKMQAVDAFCLVCQCPVLVMDEHQNHDVCSLDKAYEDLKDRLTNWISTLQERSENIEDMVSEIELAYNSVEEHCKTSEQAMDDQNEEMLKQVMDQYNEMSQAMEEEKKAKLEKLYDQIVSFQESIDSTKETLEKNSKELEDESDPLTFVFSSKDINMSLAQALESTMSMELGPRGLSVFDDYAKGSGNGQKHRKGIPVPQKPHLQPQEANSATTTSVTVYWTVNEGDIIDCFQVYCMEDPQGAISEEYRVTVKESYCTLEELDPDKCYKVWVMAVNYTGCSLPSERLSFKTAPSGPVIQPEQCTVLWDSATLRWTPEQPSAAESFTLEYCRQYACEGEGLRSISGIKGSEQTVLLQPNENYLFYIKAVNSAGASEQSEATLISTRGTRFHVLKETASPALRLSEDKTTVLYSQDSFSETSSINECPAILGELLPLKGYYYWETVVSGCPSYRLGVAYNSTPSDSLLGENSTSWCLHCVPTSSSCRFELLHNSVQTDIFVADVPTRVGTLLDFVQGRLVFFNAQNGHLLGSTQHTFTEACHAAFGLESPGSLSLHMPLEVPDFARHC